MGPKNDTPRRAQINFRVSEDERAAYGEAAEAADLPMGDWIRMVLGAAAGNSGLVGQLVRARRAASRLDASASP